MGYRDEVERILRSRPRTRASESATRQEQYEVLVDNHHEAILELQKALVRVADLLDARDRAESGEPEPEPEL